MRRNRTVVQPAVQHGIDPASMSGEVTTRNNVPIPYRPCGGSGDFHSPIPDDFRRPHVAPFNAQYMQNQVNHRDDWQNMAYPKSSRELIVPPVLGSSQEFLQSRQSPTSIDPRYYRLRTYTIVDSNGNSSQSTGL
jgi:hypothetical protein